MAAAPAAAAEDRVAWANRMRLLLSPKGSVNEDGSIKQEFFKPKKVMFMADKKWGDAERDKLYEGLEKLGVGAWREIRATLLPDWDETALRIKASRLLGSQSLARYPGWKGDRAAVDAEQARNKALGAATGCWKSGVLVEDDFGSVAKAIAARDGGGGGGGEAEAPAGGADAAAASKAAGKRKAR